MTTLQQRHELAKALSHKKKPKGRKKARFSLGRKFGDLLYNPKKYTDKKESFDPEVEGLFQEVEQSLDAETLAYFKDNDVDFKSEIQSTYQVLKLEKERALRKDAIGQAAEVGEEPPSWALEEDPQIHQMRRESLLFFITDLLSDFELNWHHLEWVEMAEGIKKIALQASRDHGKSYFWSMAYILWKLYRYEKGDPKSKYDRLGYLFSNSLPQAVELLEKVREEIENNPVLRKRLYPDQPVIINKEKWMDRDGRIRDRHIVIRVWSRTKLTCRNGASIIARSFGTSSRGGHPGYIIVDDPLDDTSLFSEMERKKSISYFKSTISNMLIPGGQIIVVGTPLHFEDLFSIFEENPQYVFKKYPAENKHGDPLWPGRYSKEDLKAKKEDVGSIVYTREFLLVPITDEVGIFQERFLEDAKDRTCRMVNFLDDYEVQLDRIVVGCDFAISGAAKADYSVFIIVGVDAFGNVHIIDIQRHHGMPYIDQLNELKKINKRFSPDLMMIESNQFQMIFTQELKRTTRLPVKAFKTGGRGDTITNKNHLQKGVPKVAILFENGKVILPWGDRYSRKMGKELFKEALAMMFVKGKGIQAVTGHDDIILALWMAIQGLDVGSFGIEMA